ncbi:hypothetical protein IC803_11655 [Geobacillus sp. 46C-IIa]|nr:hypothetical protein IC803_11655 [Geobacillus sp. 46C-IIa]
METEEMRRGKHGKKGYPKAGKALSDSLFSELPIPQCHLTYASALARIFERLVYV